MNNYAKKRIAKKQKLTDSKLRQQLRSTSVLCSGFLTQVFRMQKLHWGGGGGRYVFSEPCDPPYFYRMLT
jgi:hypothetical protein